LIGGGAMTAFAATAFEMAALAIPMLLLAVALQVVLARWVMRDAEGRGLDPVVWGTVVFTTSLFGLATYILLRPSD